MLANRIKSLFLSSVLLASVLSVASVATAVEVGEKAPDFTLPSTTGKDISLSEFLREETCPHRVLWRRFRPHVSQEPLDQEGRFQQIPGSERPASRDQRQRSLFAESVCRFTQVAVSHSSATSEQNAATKAYGVISRRRNDGDRSSSWISRESSAGSGSARTQGVFSNEPLLKAVQEIAGKPAEDAGEKEPSGM